uniref:Uncharacterized protein n=1 Tax=Myotis myotis TaxID=51298 RepID=A0A7J8AMQ6_MYOMY|nr:hypothetical protein mMyoMyo1_008175 [Myotis myotis]
MQLTPACRGPDSARHEYLPLASTSYHTSSPGVDVGEATGEGHHSAGSFPADSSNPLLTTPHTPEGKLGLRQDFQAAMVIASLLDSPHLNPPPHPYSRRLYCQSHYQMFQCPAQGLPGHSLLEMY